MSNDSWIIVADNGPAGALAAKARGLDGRVVAMVAGPRERAEAAAAAGVDEVVWYTASDAVPAEAHGAAIAEAAAEARPPLILAADAPASRVLLGAVAARLGATVVSSVTTVRLDADGVVVERSVAEGRAIEELHSSGPVTGLILEGGDEAERPPSPVKVSVAGELDPGDRLQVVATHEDTSGGVELASADRVVGVGLGIGAKENIALVEALAKALKAELACSLPLCDDYRWFEHSRVVGSSTQRISPRLYVAIGVSGQPQHMMGVRGVRTVVAINHDAEAPIFRASAYGIVGDLHAVVPVLTAALSRS